MAQLTLRRDKGSALTNAEMDDNLFNINEELVSKSETNIDIVAGANISVTSDEAGGIKTYTIAGEAGGGTGTPLDSNGLYLVYEQVFTRAPIAGRIADTTYAIEADKSYVICLKQPTDDTQPDYEFFIPTDFLNLTILPASITTVAAAQSGGYLLRSRLTSQIFYRRAGNILAMSEPGLSAVGDIGLKIFEIRGAKGQDGDLLSNERITEVIKALPEANPYHYNIKYGQKTTRQQANSFEAGITANEETGEGTRIDLLNGRSSTFASDNDLLTTTKSYKMLLIDGELPSNILPDIPFITKWEGTLFLDVNSTQASSSFLKVTLVFTHFVGGQDGIPEFVDRRTFEVRPLGNDVSSVALSTYDSSVTLSSANVASSVSNMALPDNMKVKVELEFELFSDDNFTVRRNLQGFSEFGVKLSQAGVNFLQLAKNIGAKGDDANIDVVAGSGISVAESEVNGVKTYTLSIGDGTPTATDSIDFSYGKLDESGVYTETSMSSGITSWDLSLPELLKGESWQFSLTTENYNSISNLRIHHGTGPLSDATDAFVVSVNGDNTIFTSAVSVSGTAAFDFHITGDRI